MTDTVEQTFDHLNQEMAMIHLSWRNYRELFATDESRLTLLNDLVPGFGWLVHRVLIDYVILGICRVCDHRKDTVRVQRLVAALTTRMTPDEFNLLKALQDKIVTGADSLKEHRDKRIAHSGAQLLLAKAYVLPTVSRQAIEDVLGDLVALMNNAAGRLWGSEMDYHVINPGDAGGLIWCLQQAMRLRELQDNHHLKRLSPDAIIEKLADRRF